MTPPRKATVTIDLFRLASLTPMQAQRLPRDAAIYTLRQQGYSERTIARAFGLSRRTIQAIISRLESLRVHANNPQVHDPKADRQRRRRLRRPPGNGAATA